jgi:hypothetical protein
MTPRVLTAVAGFVVVFALLISIAPTGRHERVSAWIVPASVCGGFGGTRSAMLVDDVAGTAANRTYGVVCGDGVRTLWSQP